MTYDIIHIGTSGWGEVWCKEFLPSAIDADLFNVVAAVDLSEEALKNAKNELGMPEDRCYTDIEEAFSEHEVDFCTNAVPPAARESIVDAAIDYNLDIFSEKPIAETLETSVRIAKKVEEADVKMGITMSHRFDRDKTTLRKYLRSNKPGPLDYLVCRFTANTRSSGSRYPALVEGGVHQLDILADLAESRCERLYAQTWHPEWGTGTEDGQALVNMTFENGVRATYEGTKTNAAGLNGWGHDYIRAECRDETVVLDRREIERFEYDSDDEGNWPGVKPGTGSEIPLLNSRNTWSHLWLIEQFIEWIEGGEPMVTNVQDNLQSMALVEAALLSSQTGDPVAVQKLLEDTEQSLTT
nr:Gfo/Idh/MocA family oxidoreductase [Haladaptatus pallidirubidus]